MNNLKSAQAKDEPTDYRKCAFCGERTVPFGIDWLWWHEGMPVGVECMKKLKPSEPAVQPQPSKAVEEDRELEKVRDAISHYKAEPLEYGEPELILTALPSYHHDALTPQEIIILWPELEKAISALQSWKDTQVLEARIEGIQYGNLQFGMPNGSANMYREIENLRAEIRQRLEGNRNA